MGAHSTARCAGAAAERAERPGTRVHARRSLSVQARSAPAGPCCGADAGLPPGQGLRHGQGALCLLPSAGMQGCQSCRPGGPGWAAWCRRWPKLGRATAIPVTALCIRVPLCHIAVMGLARCMCILLPQPTRPCPDWPLTACGRFGGDAALQLQVMCTLACRA